MIKKIAIFCIKLYQIILSPFIRNRCRFLPSCSFYAKTAIKRHGIFYGGYLTIRRLFKCHPCYRGNWFDPVP